jgi:hypothetical protein
MSPFRLSTRGTNRSVQGGVETAEAGRRSANLTLKENIDMAAIFPPPCPRNVDQDAYQTSVSRTILYHTRSDLTNSGFAIYYTLVLYIEV